MRSKSLQRKSFQYDSAPHGLRPRCMDIFNWPIGYNQTNQWQSTSANLGRYSSAASQKKKSHNDTSSEVMMLTTPAQQIDFMVLCTLLQFLETNLDFD